MKKVVNQMPTVIPAPTQAENDYAIMLPVVTAKQTVRDSLIVANKACLTLTQNGQPLFTREVEGLSLSKSYATLSGIFHYQLKGKKVRLDKFNSLSLVLTFGEATYKATKDAHTNIKGEYVPYTSGSVGSLLKTLYHNFAADIMEAVTLKGTFFNFVHAANTIANFTRVPEKKATPQIIK